MYKLLLFVCIFLGSSAVSSAKQLAVSIDDLPFIYGRFLSDSEGSERFREILRVLKKHEVRVIGFVVGGQIKTDRSDLLDELIADGHVVGNHTFTHADLNSTSIDSYLDDIARCEKAIRPWVGSMKYYRYPCLHQGPTKAKYSAVTRYLEAHGYINVPVTIDNDDWLYNREYQEALHKRDTAAADSIGRAYLGHMQERTHYFDSLACARLNRDINHILLIHMNELNSVYLDQLLTWYEEQGWFFVTPEEALKDSIYRIQDTYIGPNGTSWLLRF
jgi:peptidoglycan-N-acetylglucosamine deacetylase